MLACYFSLVFMLFSLILLPNFQYAGLLLFSTVYAFLPILLNSIFYITIGIIGFFQGRFGSLVMTITLIMLGSTLGFLLHNFHPAKIFAGDCATFMGFIIAVIALLGFKNVTLTSFLVPVLILAIPILDTAFAILRRIINHKPISMPDKNHLHHHTILKRYKMRIVHFLNI